MLELVRLLNPKRKSNLNRAWSALPFTLLRNMKLSRKALQIVSIFILLLLIAGFYFAVKNWVLPHALQAKVHLFFNRSSLTNLALHIVKQDYRSVHWYIGEGIVPLMVTETVDERELYDNRPRCVNLPVENFFLVHDQNGSMIVLSCTQSELLFQLISEAGGKRLRAGQLDGSVSIHFGYKGDSQVNGEIYLVFRPKYQEIANCKHEDYAEEFGECLIGNREDWYIVWQWIRYPACNPEELLQTI